jgi:hypothetical protein
MRTGPAPSISTGHAAAVQRASQLLEGLTFRRVLWVTAICAAATAARVLSISVSLWLSVRMAPVAITNQAQTVSVTRPVAMDELLGDRTERYVIGFLLALFMANMGAM